MASKFQKFLAENRIKYPPHARRDDGVYDYYHGVKVLDPYRWLEDADSDETKEFVRRQNSITTPYLMSCPERSLLNAELVKLWDHPKFSCPFKRGPSYYVFINPGMKNQSILYKQKTLYSPAKVFLDPNEFSADGTVSLSGTSFSEDGKTLAYAISVSGSDWVTIKFRNVRTGMDYPDELHNVKFSSITWTSDNRGVFYGCYIDRSTQNGKRTTAVENQRLFYHILGTSQLTDIMVVEFPQHPKWRMTAIPLDCSLYRVLLVMPCLSPNENQVYIGSLPDVIDRSIYVWPLIGKFEASYEFVTNMDTRLLFRTNKDAPNYRVIIIDLEKPSPSNWITLIHEHPRDVLDWVSPVAMDKMVCCYLQDVKIRELGTGNHIHTIHLGLGSITGFSGRHNQSEIFFAFTSFLVPGIIYKVDLAKDIWEPEVYREVKINSLKEDDYVAYQIFYESFDKTRIPMFLAHRKTLTLNGKNPTLIYGYGGFSVCSTPTFSVTRMVFMSHFNGIVAVPNLRGGGEYGELWHDAGRLKNKKNSFHDFIASAEFLIDSGHTNPSRIAVMGASNGGMLVAGATNMRPDLFGVVIAQVGVMDLLRFSNFTIGYAWASDFGDPQTNPSDFKNMYALSPLHNIQTPKNGQYPAVLLLTADHDDRVVPLHSFKFIAELQRQAISNPYQKNPLLIRVETNTGHGGGKPTHKVLEECTDILCFIALGMDIQRSTISSLPAKSKPVQPLQSIQNPTPSAGGFWCVSLAAPCVDSGAGTSKSKKSISPTDTTTPSFGPKETRKTKMAASVSIPPIIPAPRPNCVVLTRTEAGELLTEEVGAICNAPVDTSSSSGRESTSSSSSFRDTHRRRPRRFSSHEQRNRWLIETGIRGIKLPPARFVYRQWTMKDVIMDIQRKRRKRAYFAASASFSKIGCQKQKQTDASNRPSNERINSTGSGAASFENIYAGKVTIPKRFLNPAKGKIPPVRTLQTERTAPKYSLPEQKKCVHSGMKTSDPTNSKRANQRFNLQKIASNPLQMKTLPLRPIPAKRNVTNLVQGKKGVSQVSKFPGMRKNTFLKDQIAVLPQMPVFHPKEYCYLSSGEEYSIRDSFCSSVQNVAVTSPMPPRGGSVISVMSTGAVHAFSYYSQSFDSYSDYYESSDGKRNITTDQEAKTETLTAETSFCKCLRIQVRLPREAAQLPSALSMQYASKKVQTKRSTRCWKMQKPRKLQSKLKPKKQSRVRKRSGVRVKRSVSPLQCRNWRRQGRSSQKRITIATRIRAGMDVQDDFDQGNRTPHYELQRPLEIDVRGPTKIQRLRCFSEIFDSPQSVEYMSNGLFENRTFSPRILPARNGETTPIAVEDLENSVESLLKLESAGGNVSLSPAFEVRSLEMSAVFSNEKTNEASGTSLKTNLGFFKRARLFSDAVVEGLQVVGRGFAYALNPTMNLGKQSKSIQTDGNTTPLTSKQPEQRLSSETQNTIEKDLRSGGTSRSNSRTKAAQEKQLLPSNKAGKKSTQEKELLPSNKAGKKSTQGISQNVDPQTPQLQAVSDSIDEPLRHVLYNEHFAVVHGLKMNIKMKKKPTQTFDHTGSILHGLHMPVFFSKEGFDKISEEGPRFRSPTKKSGKQGNQHFKEHGNKEKNEYRGGEKEERDIVGYNPFVLTVQRNKKQNRDLSYLNFSRLQMQFHKELNALEGMNVRDVHFDYFKKERHLNVHRKHAPSFVAEKNVESINTTLGLYETVSVRAERKAEAKAKKAARRKRRRRNTQY